MKRQKKKKNKVHVKLVEKCINCGEKGAHFVPPSFGDKGFFICESNENNGEKHYAETS